MEIQTTFCHNQDESARDLSPPPSCQSPLDWLSGQLDDLTAQAGFDDADWGLIEKYLLMSLFDIHSIRELAISAKERNRLYWLMSQKYRPLEKVLTQVGYELFFAEVEAFESASACDRSRYRPHLIGDDTKVAKTHACCMEYLTETLLSGRRTETASLQSGGALCYLRRHRLGNPGGDKALGTQGSPRLSIEAEIAQSDCRLAKGFSANPWLVADWGTIQL